MTVYELIKELENYSPETNVRIFDWKKNMLDDSGDGSFEGIYPIEIEYHNLQGDEKEYWEERNGKDYNPWIALMFTNEDL